LIDSRGSCSVARFRCRAVADGVAGATAITPGGSSSAEARKGDPIRSAKATDSKGSVERGVCDQNRQSVPLDGPVARGYGVAPALKKRGDGTASTARAGVLVLDESNKTADIEHSRSP